METIQMQLALHRVAAALVIYEQLLPQIDRISAIVQANQELFDVRPGNCALTAAADMLERIVQDHKLKKPPVTGRRHKRS